MSIEEFKAWLDRHDALEKAADEAWKAYSNRLPRELFVYIQEHYPNHFTENCDKTKRLKEILQEIARPFLENLFFSTRVKEDDTRFSDPLSPPSPADREKSEADLQATIKKFREEYGCNDEDIAELVKYHWEDFEHTQKFRYFKHGLHRLAKENLTRYYANYIMEMHATAIRTLESTTFRTTEFTLVESVMELVEN